MRLIDADPLIAQCEENAIEEWNKRVSPVSWADAEEEFAERLYEAPVIDAVPVVHGRWMDAPRHMLFGELTNCSVCGWQMDVHANRGYHRFCPNCGARMDGEQ